MATTTRATLRQRLSEAIGDYQSLTTTGAATGTTDIVDANLKNLPGGGDPGAFEEWYALIGAGQTNEGAIRRIKSYQPNTTTLIVEQAYDSAVDTGINYELHRYHPNDKHNAINRATEELFPFMYLPISDETLVVDDVLSNSDFETFSDGFTGWTEVGSPASVSADTTYLMHGAYSAKVEASGSATAQLTQAPTLNVNEISQKTATFKCWVWCDTASKARIRIDWDGANIEDSDYHAGQSEWELLDVTVSVPSTATQVKVICEVGTSTTAYFDACWLAVEPQFQYTVPSSMLLGPYKILQQNSDTDPDGPYYPIMPETAPVTGRRLRLIGIGLLSRPTTDTGTVEIGEPHISMLVSYAAMFMFRMMSASTAIEQNDRYLTASQIWSSDASRMASMSGMKMPKPSAEGNHRIWHMERDGENKYIRFDRIRYGAYTGVS